MQSDRRGFSFSILPIFSPLSFPRKRVFNASHLTTYARAKENIGWSSVTRSKMKKERQNGAGREGTWQSDQRNGSCIIEMQFQYRYVGLFRLSISSGDHRESRPSKKKLDAMEITERPRMQHAVVYARGSQNIAKDRVKLSEILLNGSAVNNTKRGDERKEWVPPTHTLQLQLNYIHRTDSEPHVHKELKNDVRFAWCINVLSNKERQKNWILVLRDNDIRG